MYIWTGLVFEEDDEKRIRNICKEVNKKYNLSELSFTLPQHISLKTSFYYDNYNVIIDYIKSLLINSKKIVFKITGISKINNGVIWFDIEEKKELSDLHNLLNNKLKEKYNIPLIKYDGDNFKFHSTLFQDNNISDEYNSMISELNNYFNFPLEFESSKINIGLSYNGSVGTFKIFDKIDLK